MEVDRKLLEEYGQHKSGCPKDPSRGYEFKAADDDRPRNPQCSCGFDAALSQPQPLAKHYIGDEALTDLVVDNLDEFLEEPSPTPLAFLPREGITLESLEDGRQSETIDLGTTPSELMPSILTECEVCGYRYDTPECPSCEIRAATFDEAYDLVFRMVHEGGWPFMRKHFMEVFKLKAAEARGEK